MERRQLYRSFELLTDVVVDERCLAHCGAAMDQTVRDGIHIAGARCELREGCDRIGVPVDLLRVLDRGHQRR